MKTQVTVNNVQRLFVIPCGGGYSCFGFDNCYEESVQLFNQIPNGPKELWPNPEEKGTLKQYDNYRQLIRLAEPHIKNKTWFHLNTPERVRDILENARITGKRLRLFYGDTDTGRNWMDEYDMVGSIGRSTGTMKIPLLISNSRSSGGGAILDNCIIRIIDCETKRELYRHPKFNMPTLTIVDNEHPEYAATALADGKVHARFKSRLAADRWVAFMKGERMGK
jgi:hypothetical protein